MSMTVPQYWAGLIFLALCMVHFVQTRWTNLPLPTVQRTWRQMLQWSSPFSELVENGYVHVIKNSGKPFKVWYWGREYVVMPMKYLPDIKRADKRHLDFFKSIQDVFYLKFWLGDLFDTDRMVYTVKKGLNPRLNEATQLCIDECAPAFSEELGDCSIFKSVGALEAFCGIAHRAASRILVGDMLCSNPEFKAASYSYFQGHAITGGIFLYLPLGPLRNVLATPISYFQRVRQRRILSLVANEFQRRIDSSVASSVDGVDWTLRMLKEIPGKSSEPLPLFQMSHELVHLLGASHTPVGMAITQLVWQMLLCPEDLAALRSEAREAITKVGFTDRIVEYLPLQDSFIQETNRLYPNNQVSVQRLVMGEPFVFQDGLTLPTGTRLAFATGPHLRDPDVFDNPDVFDGYRFVKLTKAEARTQDGVKRWAASHAHAHNLAFGYGNHVCPGRFFAVRLIKVIFTKLIMEYDIESDWKGEGMPPSLHLEGSIIPHTSARIMLRKRV